MGYAQADPQFISRLALGSFRIDRDLEHRMYPGIFPELLNRPHNRGLDNQ